MSDLPLYQAALCKWYDWGAWRPGSDHVHYNNTVQHCNMDEDGPWQRLGEVAKGTSQSDLALYQAALCKWYDWGAQRPGSDHVHHNNTVQRCNMDEDGPWQRLGEVAKGTSLSEVTWHYIKLPFASGMIGVHGDQALITFSVPTQYNNTVYHGQRWALTKAWRSGRRYFTVWLATISSSPLQAVWLGRMVHGDQADHNQNNNTVQHHCAQQQHKQASSAGTQDSLTHSSPCLLHQVWSQLRRAGCCVARTSPLWHALTWPNHPACHVQVTLCYWSNSNQPQIQNKTHTKTTHTKNTHVNCSQQQNSFSLSFFLFLTNLFHCSYRNNILLISAKCWMVR